MKLSAGLATIAALMTVSGVSAVPQWGQCGGINYTGSTICDAGLTCVRSNDWFYQCLPGSSGSTSTTSIATKTSSTSASPSSTGRVKFKYFGVNESCAEFGQNKIPGVLGTDYTWPTTASVDFFIGKGFNTFRIAFMMERISPLSTGLTGPFDATYLGDLKKIVSYVTGRGAYAVLDPHNYLRYNGAVITNQNDFSTWWKNLANEFKSDSKVIFDINNEPNGISAADAFAMNQVGVNAIRSAGATSQLILVEGTSWTGAWSWTSSGNAAAFAAIQDPNNNVAIEMHQYLDSDGSGTSDICVSNTIGAERIADATAWLKSKGLKGFLGEIGGGSNDVCIAAIKSALSLMQEPGSPWIGALWWAAGPWWGNYFQSIEPPNGAAIPRILPEALIPYL